MLYREIITVWSQIHTKHINTLCGQNVELLNIQHGSKCEIWGGHSGIAKVSTLLASDTVLKIVETKDTASQATRF